MTLDDETAANLAREVIGGGKVSRVYPHSTDVKLVRAGYAARDAEVEELRAELARFKHDAGDAWATEYTAARQAEATLAKLREWAEPLALQPDPPADDEMAGQINAAGDVLAILSPTERETPLDRLRAGLDSVLGVYAERRPPVAEKYTPSLGAIRTWYALDRAVNGEDQEFEQGIKEFDRALRERDAARDAEVEELRAQLDAAQAHAKAAAQVILAILDESPTERETPAEWEYGLADDGATEPYSDISTDRDWVLDGVHPLDEGTKLLRRRKAGPWEVCDE